MLELLVEVFAVVREVLTGFEQIPIDYR